MLPPSFRYSKLAMLIPDAMITNLMDVAHGLHAVDKFKYRYD